MFCFQITNICYRKFATLSFNLACFIFAFCVSYAQFQKYLLNEDTSSFKIKDYKEEMENNYPDISICFSISKLDNIYNKSSFPLTAASWEMETFLHLLPVENFDMGGVVK